MASNSGVAPPSQEPEREFKSFKKILLALDVSERMRAIIQIGSYLAKSFQAETLVVTVVKMSTSIRADEFDGSPANKNEESLKDSLTHLLQQYYGGYTDKMQVKILHGEPAERIAEYAEYSACDLIVIGSRRYGALKRAILGSTSSAVVGASKTSVLILK